MNMSRFKTADLIFWVCILLVFLNCLFVVFFNEYNGRIHADTKLKLEKSKDSIYMDSVYKARDDFYSSPLKPQNYD